MRVLITGGAGFVGANVAVGLAERDPSRQVIALDNLKRRGSELNIPRLGEAGVKFVHGDVRDPSDLEEVGELDALVECSAEPSALAGVDGSTSYIVRTNLVGGHNCLELARRRRAQFVFLSTSRVYSVPALTAVRYREGKTRYEIEPAQELPGISPAGISEAFPLDGYRTLYGATKLAAELLVTEYAANFELRTVINRCGVIAGPWQMGKVDQGVFSYWLLAHRFGRELRYYGYGGSGLQVRDLLHVDDLVDLVEEQLSRPAEWAGTTVNVGGGPEVSLSLRETTALCEEITGNRVVCHDAGPSRPGDVPIYISDCSRLFARTSWRPRRSARQVLEDIFSWSSANERALRLALGL